MKKWLSQEILLSLLVVYNIAPGVLWRLFKMVRLFF